MKIIKKNQLTILVIALMLVTAGYLNFTTNDNNTVPTSSANLILNETDMANIGDAKLVNSGDVIENTIYSENTINNEEKVEDDANNLVSNNEYINELGSIINGNTENIENNVNPENDIVETSSNLNSNEYFVRSRLDRETMYSQMIESYQKILESSSISNEQKAISQQEIDNINKTKNAIMISENLIKNKGFEDCILFVNDKSINVIIKKKEQLIQEEIAQIQNIISRELGAEIENIHITNRA